MIVSLSLANDFRGRIYATGNPQSCFELGTGRPDMTLRIPLGTECGTVQQVRDDAKMRHSVKNRERSRCYLIILLSNKVKTLQFVCLFMKKKLKNWEK